MGYIANYLIRDKVPSFATTCGRVAVFRHNFRAQSSLRSIMFMYRPSSSKFQDRHDGKRGAFEPKITGYHDPRVFSEHCLLTALPPTHDRLRWPTDRSEGLGIYHYPKRLRLVTPVDLAKICYEVLTEICSRHGAMQHSV
jgi:hypothetical protein